MNYSMEEFHPAKKYLICVDSDGCVMDSMDWKHKKCFGPIMIQEFSLEKHEKKLLTRWDEINLYSMTRGINRFLSLEMLLKEVNASLQPIEGLEEYLMWVNKTKELSNHSLEEECKSTNSAILNHVLNWSKKVNERIGELSYLGKPFPDMERHLHHLHQFADIAVVSSANHSAVEKEWTEYHCIDHVDVLMTQEYGSKAACIAKLKNTGYEADHILMIGDAPGDLSAAKHNEVLFYPILVGKEAESWDRLCKDLVKNFIDADFRNNYQDQLIQEFQNNFI